jgi:hypothetical protein
VTPPYHRSHDWPIYVIGALPLVGVLFLLAAELPARLGGGRWRPLSSGNWLERATSSLCDPSIRLRPGLPAAGPRGRWRTGRRWRCSSPLSWSRSCSSAAGGPTAAGADGAGVRPGFATAREVRAALDGAEAGRIAAISVSLPVIRPRAARSDPPTSAAPSGDQEGGR